MTVLLYAFYRRSLKATPDARERVMELDPRCQLKSERLLPILAVLGGTIVGFFLHAPLHVEPVVVAMTGATVMLLVAGRDMNEIRVPVRASAETAAKLAAAAIRVALPPKQAPSARAHQVASSKPSAWSSSTTGIIAAVKGMLSTSAEPAVAPQFLAIGLPITFVSLLIATAYLLAFQL